MVAFHFSTLALLLASTLAIPGALGAPTRNNDLTSSQADLDSTNNSAQEAAASVEPWRKHVQSVESDLNDLAAVADHSELNWEYKVIFREVYQQLTDSRADPTWTQTQRETLQSDVTELLTVARSLYTKNGHQTPEWPFLPLSDWPKLLPFVINNISNFESGSLSQLDHYVQVIEATITGWAQSRGFDPDVTDTYSL